MYFNINGASLLVQLLALSGALALGLRIFSVKPRRGSMIKVKYEDQTKGTRTRQSKYYD